MNDYIIGIDWGNNKDFTVSNTFHHTWCKTCNKVTVHLKGVCTNCVKKVDDDTTK